MDPEDMPNEIDQIQKDKYGIIPLLLSIYNSQIHRERVH